MSNRWPAGIIRQTPVTPAGPLQNGAASGVWSLADASYWTKQGLWPIAGNFLAVEDVFSTYLYTGNSSTQTITNGIDLSGKGGLVWTKSRNGAFNHCLIDTVRGVGQTLYSDSNVGNQNYGSGGVNSFSSTGYGLASNTEWNNSSYTYASWTFREAPKFFDVVTYTGTGSNRTIAHNLGVAPGCIIVKRTDTASNWFVYHRGLTSATYYDKFNDYTAEVSDATVWNSTAPTSTVFSVGTSTGTNASGGTYVAYIFAHDTAENGIIQCGSFTTDGSGSATVNLGWEPQWLITKDEGGNNYFTQYDNMRGWTGEGSGISGNSRLLVGASNTESGNNDINVLSNGFKLTQYASTKYIYIAIRRGPMRTPTLGTSVFAPNTSSASVNTQITTNFPVDMQFLTVLGGGSTEMYVATRLTGVPSTLTTANFPYLNPRSTAAETSFNLVNNWNNTGFAVSSYYNASSQLYWNFRRAPGFFDVVCYTGTGVARTVAHNLGVAPEFIIAKSRSSAFNWTVYSSTLGNSYPLFLQSTSAGTTNYGALMWGSTPPTTNQFPVGTYTGTNLSGAYVAYLFASCPGVSKVGSYTGNGSSQTINCAFTTGARYVLIKRTDSTGNWLVWDSARGIVAGNDPYVAVNSSAAQVTTDDSVDTDNSGFIVNQVSASNINVNAATYIFLAIA